MQTNEFLYDVLRLKALDGHRLWIRFSGGSEGVRDFSDILAAGGPMAEPLKAPDYFARLRCDGRTDLAQRLRRRSYQSLHAIARRQRADAGGRGVRH
jgi:hypothetical protein